MHNEYLLQKFYNFSKIPLSIYHNGKLINQICIKPFYSSIIIESLQDAVNKKNDLVYKIFFESIFLGIIHLNGTDEYAVLGPVASNFYTKHEIRNSIKKLNITENITQSLLNNFSKLTSLSIIGFKDSLELFDGIFNGNRDRKPILLDDIRNSKINWEDYKDLSYIDHIREELGQKLFSYIEFGRPHDFDDEMKSILSNHYSLPEVVLGKVQSARVIFTMIISQASEAALKGGLPYDIMNSMRKHYLTYIEKIDSLKKFGDFFTKMCMDFSTRTAEIQSFKSNSTLAIKINKMINSYIYEKISPAVIADRLQLNTSYICRHFKESTGKTISEHINKVKIDEAKKLLSSTTLNINDISDQFGYTDSNYFYRVFKKHTGQTPTNYRKSTAK